MVVIEIPDEVCEVLAELARRKGVSIEELLVEIVLAGLDPGTRIEIYLKMSDKYLREAEELHQKGELTQAGEKYWGSVVALLKAIAEARDRRHYSHRDIRELVSDLVEETKDRDLAIGYSAAERLHANFYEDFMRPTDFEFIRAVVLELIEGLKRIVGRC